MKGYSAFKELKVQELGLSSQNISPALPFTYQVKMKNVSIGEGSGSTKAQAKENAAKEACDYLIKNNLLKSDRTEIKNYRTFLKEWMDQGNILDYLLTLNRSSAEFKFQIKIDEEIMVEGTAATKKEAKENAYGAAFEKLLKEQDKDRKDKENLKESAKKVKKSPEINLHSSTSKSEGVPSSFKQGEKRTRKPQVLEIEKQILSLPISMSQTNKTEEQKIIIEAPSKKKKPLKQNVQKPKKENYNGASDSKEI